MTTTNREMILISLHRAGFLSKLSPVFNKMALPAHCHREEETTMRRTISMPAIITAIIIPLLLLSCATTQTGKKAEKTYQMYVNGTVQSISPENVMTILLETPDMKTAQDPAIGEIAKKVIEKARFIEGITTIIDGVPVVVKEVRGNIISVFSEKPVSHPVGSAVRLKIPKKTIAVVDFEVIRGNQKEVGRVTLEGLTSALIESGQFNVVERAKLKTIIHELELSMTGLMEESSDKRVGMLKMADLILTGTLAQMKGTWNVNLRLLSVRTGQALAAISMQTPLFRRSEMRDSGPLDENFEDDFVDASWLTGYRNKGLFRIRQDIHEGAEDSRHSLQVSFDFGKSSARSFARVENRKKRDLYFYSGIEFYVKSTVPLTGKLFMTTSDPDDPNIMDGWTGNFELETTWRRIRIPFESLVIGRGWIKGGAKKYGARSGDQILRLDRVENFSIGVANFDNPQVPGTIWVDKIRFYD